MIGLDSGLAPIQRQAIIWIDTGLLLVWPSGIHFSENFIRSQQFLYENEFENVCNMAAILSLLQWV